MIIVTFIFSVFPSNHWLPKVQFSHEPCRTNQPNSLDNYHWPISLRNNMHVISKWMGEKWNNQAPLCAVDRCNLQNAVHFGCIFQSVEARPRKDRSYKFSCGKDEKTYTSFLLLSSSSCISSLVLKQTLTNKYESQFSVKNYV